MANMARRQGLLNSASNHLNRGSSRRATTGSGRLGKTLGGLYLSQLIPALLLVVFGVVVIWSASLTIPEANFPRHLVGIAMGLVGAVLVWRYDYRNLQGMTRTLLIIACILMIASATRRRASRAGSRCQALASRFSPLSSPSSW